MSTASAQLAARTSTDYLNGGHRTYFTSDLNAVATCASEIAANATTAGAAATAAAASLASALAITGGTQGVGLAALDVPRNADLGSAAYWSADGLRGAWPVAQGAAYQITPADYGRTLIAESGTLTWTLPLLSDLDPGWWVRIWNRSGNNLTLNRSGSSDVIGSASTSLTIATASGITIAYRSTARFERIA